jgi:hypothetical protein
VANRSKQLGNDCRRLFSEAMQPSHSPSVADAAVAQARNTLPPNQRAAPLAPSALVADSGDLVARALAILAAETEAWQARKAFHLPRGGAP